MSAVVGPADLDVAVERLTAGILRAAPLTIQTTKAQLLASADARGGAEDDERLRRVYGSADFREGVRAFVARDKPAFTGR